MLGAQKNASPPKDDAPNGSRASVRDHRLQLFAHAGFNEHARLFVRDRHVERISKDPMFQVRQSTRPARLIGLHWISARRRAAALRVAFDQCDEATASSMS